MRIILIILILLFNKTIQAQQQNRPEDIFFKKYLVRSMDVREKANQEIFGSENYLIHKLLEAYCSGKLTGYENQQFSKKLSFENFENRMKLLEESGENFQSINSLHELEFGECLIFNKHTSDFYFTMESLTINIPAEKSTRGLKEPLISFNYKDCAQVLKADSNAVSYNPLKNGRDINFTDVFLLRMFNSTIVKIGNSKDLYFDQIHTDQMSTFLAAKHGENMLTEYIYKLYHPE